MAKKDLLKERIVYKPFEYPKAFDYWLKQQQAHWIHTEVPMMSDVNDWKQNLTETEKNIVGSILIYLLVCIFTQKVVKRRLKRPSFLFGN